MNGTIDMLVQLTGVVRFSSGEAGIESPFDPIVVPLRLGVRANPVMGTEDSYDLVFEAAPIAFSRTTPFQTSGTGGDMAGSVGANLTIGLVVRGRFGRPSLPSAPAVGVVVQDSFPVIDGGIAVGWQARATETTPTDALWALKVFAMCVDRP